MQLLANIFELVDPNGESQIEVLSCLPLCPSKQGPLGLPSLLACIS